MNTSKKIASAALTITTAAWMSGALLLVPAVTNAQSATDLQTQINALLAQIAQLQAQLKTSGSMTTSSSYTFTRNLTVGSKGDDVSALQKVLISGGYLNVAAPTGYFGALTKAAVAAWQKANGVSPAGGYFGPKSRAALAAAGTVTPPVTGTSTVTPPVTGTSTVTVTPPVTGTTQLPPPASGLNVAAASDNPAPGSLIAGSARASVLAVTLTAGTASGVTVSDIKLHKTGVVSDSGIAGAYLVENGKVLYQYQSLSSGVIDFGGLSLNFAAGQTRKFVFQVDTASGLTAGNTVSFTITGPNDITSTDASGASITETGNFPLNGNTFTVTSVSNPSIASLTVASSSMGTSVTAGTQNNLVGAFTFTGSNSKVWLKSVNFRVIGSATKSDIKNIKLYVNGSQVGSTLAAVSSDGTAYFDLSATPATLNTGTNNVQVFADVMGSPSFSFQFEVLNSYDIYALDSQYNTPVTAGSNSGTLVSIKQGQITVTQDTSTPTGNLAKGQSSVTLAKFDFYAAGEAVKVKWLDFGLAFVGLTNGTLSGAIKNLNITDDAGGQLGTTISSLDTSVTCSTENAYSAASSTVSNCFGNSTSPVNYIIPANTTRVLSLKGDIQSAASFTTVTASLKASTSNNLQGLTSSQTANSGAATGGALTLSASSLTVAQNSGFGTPSYAANSTNHKVGSYAFTASSAEGVTISNMTVKMAYGDEMQNLKAMIGSTQFGTTQGTLSSSGSFSFSGTPFTVPAGATTYVDVYADLLSTASGTLTAATTLSGCSGSGQVSYTAVSCTSTAGQNVAIAGQPTLQIALDSTAPAANQLVMGSTGNVLGAYLFTETTNADSVKVTDLHVKDAVSATSTVLAGFQNLCFYQGATNLGCAGAAAVNGTSSDYLYSFHFSTPVVVAQAGSLTLTLKGDVSSFASSGASDNTTHAFKIDTSGDANNLTAAKLITALGQTSNATATITTSTTAVPSGNTMTVLRTKLTVTGTNAATTARSQSAVDDIGTINFAADAAGTLTLGSVTVTFSGSAPSSVQFWNTTTTGYTSTCSTCYVTLYDVALGKSYFPVAEATTSAINGTLAYDLNNYTLSAGSSKSFNLRLNTAQSGVLQNAGSNATTKSLAATIAAGANVTWTDAISGGNAISSIPSYVIPITISSVTYTY